MQKIKLYTFGLSAVCLVFGIALIVLSVSVAPDRTGNILLFYFLFAVFIFSTANLIGFLLRRRFGQRELLNQYLRQSARQGLWFTILLALSLLLLSQTLFSWVSGGLLLLTLVFLESYLLTKNNK